MKIQKSILAGVLAAALVLALTMIAYAQTLAPYKDQDLFHARYGALAMGDDQAYSSLRDDMLMPKFFLEDYGMTLCLLAVVGMLLVRRGWRSAETPKSRIGMLLLAYSCPLLTAGADFFDLYQSYSRGEYPHWADSMGAGVLVVLALLPVMFAWVIAHLLWLQRPCQAVPVSSAFSRDAEAWLLVMAGIAAALLLLSVVAGQYWYAISSIAWLYFYLSLAALRRYPVSRELSAANG